ncbi:MAG TPA: hypothetical protein VLF20_06540 [Patescibacteria group bacterium]|nr:hypothetical protein [Patescibacteria group bacterium]
MNQTKITIIVLVLSAVVGYFVFAPPTTNTQPQTKANNQPPIETNKQEPTTTDAVTAVKEYAAFQFSVAEDQVTVVSAKKQTWDTICLGMKIEDYDCIEQKVTGYEVAVEINGTNTKYRASDDGKIIRVVKE